jgi:hypothetical protein
MVVNVAGVAAQIFVSALAQHPINDRNPRNPATHFLVMGMFVVYISDRA